MLENEKSNLSEEPTINRKRKRYKYNEFQDTPIIFTYFEKVFFKFQAFAIKSFANINTRFGLQFKKYGVRAIFPRQNVFIQIGSEMNKVVSLFLAAIVTSVIVAITAVVLILSLVWPKLPELDVITNYEPILPMRIYTKDEQLIKEFGVERREFTNYQDYPTYLVHALVAAEDKRFFTHLGFDPIGIARAVFQSIKTGSRAKGTSTITQQLARNFYLNQDRTVWRKGLELLLAIKIENQLTKERILEVYMNQIYLGERSFGFASAAHSYFGKNIKDVSIADASLLASLPKSPSENIFTHPKKILKRREYVLKRMLVDGYITKEELETAKAQPLPERARGKNTNIAVEADYVAEMARQYVFDLVKKSGVENVEEFVYSKGIKVVTTIDKNRQGYANIALQQGLINYELGYGFRGEEKRYNSEQLPAKDSPEFTKKIEKLLNRLSYSQLLTPAVVISIEDKRAELYLQGGEMVWIDTNKNRKLAKFFNGKAKSQVVVGSVVRVYKQSIKKRKTKSDKNKEFAVNYKITQLPVVTGALIAINPKTGGVESLVGGFSYDITQFNNVLQAWRQPGSTFKPFIYSAAVDLGLSPATEYMDEELEIEIPGEKNWRPRNYNGRYSGPMTVRKALANSVNTVTVQIMQDITPRFVHRYLNRFGFDTSKIPAVLSLALGSGEATPWQMARAYSVFANGGYLIKPYFVREISDNSGNSYFKHPEENQLIQDNLQVDPRNIYIMNGMLHDIVTYGTGARARALKRGDLSGKTGTTNDYIDAWFCGYQASLTTVVWVGYRNPRKLGRSATGGRLALPVWMDYMGKALKGVPEERLRRPANIGEVGGEPILKEFEQALEKLDDFIDELPNDETGYEDDFFSDFPSDGNTNNPQEEFSPPDIQFF